MSNRALVLVLVIVVALSALLIFMVRSQAPEQSGDATGEVRQMKATSRGRRSHR